MDKKNLLLISIVVLLLIILGVVGGYYYVKNKKPAASTATDIQSVVDAVGSVTESATQGVLPSIGVAANPLTNKPDINPTSKTNPFQ